MIEEHVKIHDKLSTELKVGFVARKKRKASKFALDMWMFIPSSLDINRFTYSKDKFYRDLKSNIRLITPVFLLRDIAESKNSAFSFLSKSFNNLASHPTRTNKEDYEYQIKMFVSILKSSLREEAAHITAANTSGIDYLLTNYCRYVKCIAERYRELYRIINVPTVNQQLLEYFRFGDEYMSNTIEYHTFRLLQGLKQQKQQAFPAYKQTLLQIINSEINYRKKQGYPVLEKDEHSDIVHRLGMLKKFAESQLFLDIDKRKDGVWAEQLFLSLAAGISMIFATAVAFSVQQKYGNLTMPFFVALVVSYMLKDRIKEFARYYFAHKMGSRYFDHKINMSVNQNNIGWSRESMDFISEQNVPADIMKARDRTSFLESNHRAYHEKVLLYRTEMLIKRDRLDSSSPFFITGINSIIRFNVSHLMQNMDNATFPIFYPDADEGYKLIEREKYYYLNLVIRKQAENQHELQRYRIVLNRKGIHEICKL